MNEKQKIIANLGIMHHTIRKFADEKFMEIQKELSGMFVFVLLYLAKQEQAHKKVFQKRSGTGISNFQSHCVTHAFQNGAEESCKKKGKCGRCTV